MTKANALQQLKTLRDEAKTNMKSYRVEALDMAITLLEEEAAKERGTTIEIGVALTAYIQTSYEDYTHIYKNISIVIPDDGNEWHVAGEAWRKK